MKRYILALTLLLVGSSIFAYCVAGATLANASIPCASNLGTAANVNALLWIQGNAVWGTNNDTAQAPGTCTGGCDSQGVSLVDTACSFSNAFILQDGSVCGTGAGTYILLTDWGTTTFDGCPDTSNAATRACLLIYDNTTGNYVLQSRGALEGWTAWDSIGTTAAAPLSAATGTISSVDPNTQPCTVTWTALPAAVVNGAYAAGDAPAAALVTTFNVYTYTGAVAPTDFRTSAWTSLATGIAEGTATSAYTFADPGAGIGMWISRSIVIDGRELPFVSTSYVPLYDPSGAPAIKAVSATHSGLTTTVNWTSGDESQVTGYQVFWAPQGGEFTAVGSQVSPAGNDHNYTASVRIPSTTTFSVKVGAYKTNGQVEYSAATLVKSANVIKDKTKVNVN